MNVSRRDFVGAVKDERIPVHHHSPDQRSIRQGENNSKHLTTARDPTNSHVRVWEFYIIYNEDSFSKPSQHKT
jgi:hypothetical protein